MPTMAALNGFSEYRNFILRAENTVLPIDYPTHDTIIMFHRHTNRKLASSVVNVAVRLIKYSIHCLLRNANLKLPVFNSD